MIIHPRPYPLAASRPRAITVRRARRQIHQALLETLEARTLLSSFVVTNTLDDGSTGSLRWAVEQANTTSGADSITFDPTVFSTPQTITLTTGQLELNDISGATSITAPAAGVTINAQGLSRIFQIDASVTASISGVAITGGSSYNGGGLANYGTVTLTQCTVSGNSATNNGAGLFTDGFGTTTLTNCTVSDNSGYQGAVFNASGTTVLTNTTVSGNSASFGAGVYTQANGTTALTDCTVSGNSASAIGDGVYTKGGSTTLINCTVSGNSGFGDVYSYNGTTTTLTNTIVGDLEGSASGSHNLISGNSGGLVNGVDGNIVGVASDLAPLGFYGGTGETMPLLPGSPAINAGTSGAGIPTTDERGLSRFGAVDIGAFESQGFNFAIVPGSTPQTANIGTTFAHPLALTVTANNPIEPVDGAVVSFIAHPAANGATAMFIGSSSGIVTNGQVSVTVAPNNALGHYTVTSAIPGFSGSFSLTNAGTPFSSLAVNTTSDALLPGAGLLSLREAVAFANTDSKPTSSITFDKTAFKTAKTITLTGGALDLNDTTGTTSITGPAAGVTISGGGLSGVFQVDSLVTASITGVTITGGNAYSGGGVDNSGTLSLTKCTVSGNSAYSGGGGIPQQPAPPRSPTASITGNSAVSGYGGGLTSAYGTAALTNSTISGNSSNGFRSSGGGVLNQGGAVTLTNCTVSGNFAPAGGGGVFSFFGTITMTNTMVSGNSASSGDGGGINNEGATVTLTNCTVSGNSAPSGGGVASSGVGIGSYYNGQFHFNSVNGTTTLTNCSVSGNSATGPGTFPGRRRRTAHLRNRCEFADQLHRDRQLCHQQRRRDVLPRLCPQHVLRTQLLRHRHADQLHRQRQHRRQKWRRTRQRCLRQHHRHQLHHHCQLHHRRRRRHQHHRRYHHNLQIPHHPQPGQRPFRRHRHRRRYRL